MTKTRDLADLGGGFIQAGTGAVQRTVESKLQDVVSVKDFGAVGDGVADDTAAIQAAVDSGASELYFPTSTYLMGQVTITSNVSLFGERNGSIILRPNNFDGNNVNLGVATAHFNIASGGIEVDISGFTFNGNEAGQPVSNPSSSSIKFYNQTGTTYSKISIGDCTFLNQTQAAILLKGRDTTNERQYVSVTNCVFINGRPGIGQDDPQSPNVNGYAPDSILVLDHIDCTVTDCVFSFDTPTPTGVYSRQGVRITIIDAATNEDGASAVIKGCRFYRMGRRDQYYDGSLNGNNALGVIDAYAKGRELVVSGNRFESCETSAIRGKTNLDMAAISNNIIISTPKAINLGPPTYLEQRGYYTITGNIIKDSFQFGISVVGIDTSTPTEIVSVSITGNVIEGVDPFALANVNGGIYVRYIQNLSITANCILNANGAGTETIHGIAARNSDDLCISANTIRNASGAGIFLQDIAVGATVSDNQIVNAGEEGIIVTSNLATSGDFTVTGNHILNVVDYGVFLFNGLNMATVSSNVVNTVTGLSRGYYIPATRLAATVTGNTATGVTNPIFNSGAGDGVTDFANSWNASFTYEAAVAPSTGTWKVGDIAWDTTPSAGGKIGWVCTVAGSPGTWKAFGAIDV